MITLTILFLDHPAVKRNEKRRLALSLSLYIYIYIRVCTLYYILHCQIYNNKPVPNLCYIMSYYIMSYRVIYYHIIL